MRLLANCFGYLLSQQFSMGPPTTISPAREPIVYGLEVPI